MRILMVSSNWPPVTAGGAEAYVRDLTAALRARGDSVAAVTLGIPGDDVVGNVAPRPHRLSDHQRAGRVAQLRFHLADVWRRDTATAIERGVRAFAPDVVHTHVVTGMSVNALTTPARLGVPHVHTLHDYWLRCWRSTGTRRDQRPCGPSCRAIAHRRHAALRRSCPDVTIGISRSIVAGHEPYDVPGDVRVVLHPATPPAHGMPRADRAPDSMPTFGFLGQLNPNKGIRHFLDAASRLASEARFVTAGRGRLDAEVGRAQAAGTVDHRGWVSDEEKERFFTDIDALVVPSLWSEPAGLVVLEAAVRGVPVIASNVGGIPEYVPEPCRPLLFPPGDVDALVGRLRDFGADPTRFTVSASAVKTWDEHLDEVLAAYEAAVRTRAHRSALTRSAAATSASVSTSGQ